MKAIHIRSTIMPYSVFLTTASCPKKDFYTKRQQKRWQKRRQKRRQKGSKKAARKAAQKFIPEPVLLLS